jgi:hypothetical protein
MPLALFAKPEGKVKIVLWRLKNYRKDGVSFLNELSLSPVFDNDGKLLHLVGIQREAPLAF